MLQQHSLQVPLIFIDDVTCVADSITIKRGSSLEQPSKLELANGSWTQTHGPGLSISFTTQQNVASALFDKKDVTVPLFICFEDEVLEIHEAFIAHCEIAHGECEVEVEATGETVVSLESFK